jgi:hypothetical protein
MKTGERVSYRFLYVQLYIYIYMRLPYLRDIERWERSAFLETKHSCLFEDLRRYSTLRYIYIYKYILFLEALLAPVAMMVVVHACAGEPDARETLIWRHRCEVSNHQRPLFPLRSQFGPPRLSSHTVSTL